MPDYATRDDVVDAAGGLQRLTQIADFDDNGLEDSGLVDAVLDEAEGLINSYLRKRREVPLQVPIPAVIKAMAANMAIYILKSRRDAVTENDRMMHDDRIGWLENFAKGLVQLGVNPSPASSPTNSPTSTARPSSKAVSRDNLKGYT